MTEFDCFDPGDYDGAIGIIGHDKVVVPAGVEICHEPEGARTESLVMRLEEKGLFFFYGEERVGFPWYAVPRLYVFARDRQGRFYAVHSYPDITEESPVWRIDRDAKLTPVAGSLRALIDQLLAGEAEKSLPGEAPRLFASRAEAERAYEFIDISLPGKE